MRGSHICAAWPASRFFFQFETAGSAGSSFASSSLGTPKASCVRVSHRVCGRSLPLAVESPPRVAVVAGRSPFVMGRSLFEMGRSLRVTGSSPSGRSRLT